MKYEEFLSSEIVKIIESIIDDKDTVIDNEESYFNSIKNGFNNILNSDNFKSDIINLEEENLKVSSNDNEKDS